MKRLLPDAEQRLYLANMLLSSLIRRLRRKQPDIRHILCVKLDEIGDMATCTHVFALLKKRYPEARLSVLCKPFNRELLAHDPHVDEILTDVAQWNRRFDLVAELRGTWNTFFKSLRYLPKLRVDRATVRFAQRGKQAHELQTNFRIVEPLLRGIPFEPAQLYPGTAAEQETGAWLHNNVNGPFAVLHTGARRELRRWPAERFAALARQLHAQYGLSIVLPGGPDEQEALQALAATMEVPVQVFPAQFSLNHFAALCVKAALFVGNESGPLHIACAMNAPVVGIYGPGVREVFYPWSERNALVHHVLECNPCDQIHCVYPDSPCIRRASLEEVLDAVKQVMQPVV
ncbi:MAG: glycosyltransferase family 9 protein [Bacteroidetes bacterium]|nr:glycosyltransferase family 9 protein [Bacteroidota bacterium]